MYAILTQPYECVCVCMHTHVHIQLKWQYKLRLSFCILQIVKDLKIRHTAIYFVVNYPLNRVNLKEDNLRPI